MELLVKRRGLGQVPTCASYDATTTIPQDALVFGGGLAIAVGVVGAFFSRTHQDGFMMAAGAGLAATTAGVLWALSEPFMPSCTGPGLAILGANSVNPNQDTPIGTTNAGTPAGETS